jgi:hypothetical protein
MRRGAQAGQIAEQSDLKSNIAAEERMSRKVYQTAYFEWKMLYQLEVLTVASGGSWSRSQVVRKCNIKNSPPPQQSHHNAKVF